MLTALEIAGTLYFGTGLYFGLALLGEWIADKLDQRHGERA